MSGSGPWLESMSSVAPTSQLPDDIAEPLSNLIGQFGIESIRAAVLDRVSLEPLARWSTSAQRDMASAAGEFNPDGAFIAAREASDSLGNAEPEQTMVRRLSPRLWSFAWTAGPEHIVMVEARYLDRRDTLDATEPALARLLFLHLSRARRRGNDERAVRAAGLTWPAVERRRGRDLTSRLRAQAVPLLLLGLGALLSCWLALFSLPAAKQEQVAQQAEIARLQAMVDRTVIDHLTAALTTGDFGELQNELSGFHALGYFERAVVLNSRQRVVASVGMGNEAPVGSVVAPTFEAQAQSVPLTRSGEQLGRLLHPQRASPSDTVSMGTVRWLAIVSVLAVIGAAVALLLSLNRRR